MFISFSYNIIIEEIVVSKTVNVKSDKDIKIHVDDSNSSTSLTSLMVQHEKSTTLAMLTNHSIFSPWRKLGSVHICKPKGLDLVAI